MADDTRRRISPCDVPNRFSQTMTASTSRSAGSVRVFAALKSRRTAMSSRGVQCRSINVIHAETASHSLDDSSLGMKLVIERESAHERLGPYANGFPVHVHDCIAVTHWPAGRSVPRMAASWMLSVFLRVSSQARGVGHAGGLSNSANRVGAIRSAYRADVSSTI